MKGKQKKKKKYIYIYKYTNKQQNNPWMNFSPVIQ